MNKITRIIAGIYVWIFIPYLALNYWSWESSGSYWFFVYFGISAVIIYSVCRLIETAPKGE